MLLDGRADPHKALNGAPRCANPERAPAPAPATAPLSNGAGASSRRLRRAGRPRPRLRRRAPPPTEPRPPKCTDNSTALSKASEQGHHDVARLLREAMGVPHVPAADDGDAEGLPLGGGHHLDYETSI